MNQIKGLCLEEHYAANPTSKDFTLHKMLAVYSDNVYQTATISCRMNLFISDLQHCVLLKETFQFMYNSTCALLEDFPQTLCALPSKVGKHLL